MPSVSRLGLVDIEFYCGVFCCQTELEMMWVACDLEQGMTNIMYRMNWSFTISDCPIKNTNSTFVDKLQILN